MLLRLVTQADQLMRRASATACRSVILTSFSLPRRRAPAWRAPFTAALAPSLAARAFASDSSASLQQYEAHILYGCRVRGTHYIALPWYGCISTLMCALAVQMPILVTSSAVCI